MSVAEWVISASNSASSHYSWTPAEIAQIARAAQAFQAALPTAGGKLVHLVSISDLGVLDGSVKVTWPQPGDPVIIQLMPCPICGFKDWPEGDMHAARSIHIRQHQVK